MNENISLKLEESFPKYDEKTDRTLRRTEEDMNYASVQFSVQWTLSELRWGLKLEEKNIKLEQWSEN